jgi:hypothetical protein
VSIGRLGLSLNPPFPTIAEGEFLISFAPADDVKNYLEDGVVVSRSLMLDLKGFLGGDYDDSPVDRAKAGDLIRKLIKIAWDASSAKRLLPVFDLSNAQCSYFTKGFATEDKVFFDSIDGSRTWRQLVGYATMTSGKRFWHFAIQVKPVTHPFVGFCVKPHVLFSDDGQTIWDNPRRMHRARRSQCKNWYNPEWRDRLLAAMSWLSSTNEGIALHLASGSVAKIAKVPLDFESPVSYVEPTTIAPHDDDHLDDDDEDDPEETLEYCED